MFSVKILATNFSSLILSVCAPVRVSVFEVAYKAVRNLFRLLLQLNLKVL